MNRFRKLILLWMLAWLPASGAIAAVMPIAAVAGSSVVPPDAGSPVPADAPLFAAMPCHEANSGGNPAPAGGCTHCVLCHLAVSLLAPSMPSMPAPIPSHAFAAAPLSAHVSFIPELASPPPRYLPS